MKLATVLSALVVNGFIIANTEKAGAVVYCQYIGYPVGCVTRPAVVEAPIDVRKIPPPIDAFTGALF